jgi:hypothetical protein
LVRTINSWNKICVVTNYRIKIIILFHILLFLTITIHFSNEILKTTGKQKHQKPKKKREEEMGKQLRGISENRYHKQDENMRGTVLRR